MAKKRGVRVAIVVEDERLEHFSREVLLQFGFNRHVLRVTPYPVGQGSAKSWVDLQYPIEVQTLRRKPYQRLGVLVGTDADESSVAERHGKLAQSLRAARLPPRSDSERIVIWIPKWSVETWILYFSGENRNEDQSYKHDVKKIDFTAVVKGFVDQFRSYTKDNTIATLPSLKTAYDETRRLGA